MARHLGREGVSVGRRRVRRLMRLMGLEAVYRKPRTSAAQPGHRADITYIPVSSGFLYLVAVMDWASRHVLAWRLSNTMDTGFCIEALEAALRTGTPEIFNTDQGAHASPHFCRASDHAEDLSIHPLFHQHAPERLHQRTNPILGPIGKMVVQHQPLPKQRMRPPFHCVRLQPTVIPDPFPPPHPATTVRQSPTR